MLGPGNEHPRGFLVIVNDDSNSGTLHDQNGYETDNSPVNIRTDQLAFIVQYPDSHPLQSITGQTDSDGDLIESTTARIWYGHLVPTETATLGEEADKWTLGRQALLLVGDSTVSDDATLASNFVGGTSDVADMTLRAMTGYDQSNDATPDPQIDPDAENDYLARVFGSNRLQVANSVPTNASENDRQQLFDQMHAHLAAYCSDFQVQFAGNYDGTEGVDRDGDGQIIWYDKDNLPSGSSPGIGSSDSVFVFPYDNADDWPTMIRIRYRLHDDTGKLQAPPPEDSRFDKNTSDGSVPGRVFEHVIHVAK
jgi:hypothetical protein